MHTQVVGFILEAACALNVNVNIMAEIHRGLQLIKFFIESCEDKYSELLLMSPLLGFLEVN